jgi:hypothetical protein
MFTNLLWFDKQRLFYRYKRYQIVVRFYRINDGLLPGIVRFKCVIEEDVSFPNEEVRIRDVQPFFGVNPRNRIAFLIR